MTKHDYIRIRKRIQHTPKTPHKSMYACKLGQEENLEDTVKEKFWRKVQKQKTKSY